ncbi:glutathione S-transferase [Roseovarius mucosus]|uniref:Glutathione S-transferase n=1 Tax=Roseovarius mucosus TaxID=215743 RepID=A0A1V0RKJ0_9RHOB|nr:glutathione S-transferase family protein [Roseovarius mucosus]ARE82299.1 glutathione S-transferase [Roseovarius mucosus]
MKLYELNWALFPRRIGIYLSEKGITDIDRIAFDAMDPESLGRLRAVSSFGTVPVLQTEDGHKIRSSIAILEYLEDRYPQPNMIGWSPAAQARTRETMSIADEAALQLGVWAHKGSPVFAGMEEQHPATARFAAAAYLKQLERLDLVLTENQGPFLTGSENTIADCIAMATLQFAADVYGVHLPERLEKLRAWYEFFRQRPSAICPPYPKGFLAVAHGLPDHGFDWSLDDVGWNAALVG